MTNYNNTILFAKANSIALANRRPTEALRTIMFLEGSTIDALFRVEYCNMETNEYREVEISVEVKPLSYREQLRLANTLGISGVELEIANEVDCYFEDICEESFETFCRLVSDTYYDCDDITDIAYCTKAIIGLFKSGISIRDIEDMRGYERLDEYYELCEA